MLMHQDTNDCLGLTTSLARRVIGQPAAIAAVLPYVQMCAANLAPEGRPAGIFLLLGPTGTGKTKTVEALAAELHGSEKNMLKINCGEFQMEHEVAKLIGAPPGYLGHRETHPMISQQKLEATTSEECDLSLVLLDEIEKAAPSLGRLLLGVLDKGILHLGDNSTVNFENSLVFMTSNLGAREMMRQLSAGYGFSAAAKQPAGDLHQRLERTALNAVRRHFSPEFVNRLDEVVTYEPLSQQSLNQILDLELDDLEHLIARRLGSHAFPIEVSPRARQFLLERGTSPASGARHLKRVIHRHLTQPLAGRILSGDIRPRRKVSVRIDRNSAGLTLHQQSELFRLSA